MEFLIVNYISWPWIPTVVGLEIDSNTETVIVIIFKYIEHSIVTLQPR